MRIPVNKEGMSSILAAFFIALIVYLLDLGYWTLVPAAFMFFLIYFFRDPERKIPQGKNIIVAPADGKVEDISNLKHDKIVNGPAKSLYIFLYPWNVHINRMPVSGKILSVKKKEGKFDPAFMVKEAEKLNKENNIEIDFGKHKMELSQIVGFIARRLRCWVSAGDKINIGDRIGLIKFGSGTRLIMPRKVKILVKVGDKVRGGETVIGRY